MSDIPLQTSNPGRSRLSRGKRWAFRLVTLAAIAVLAELLSCSAMYVIGSPMRTSVIRNEQRGIAEGGRSSDGATEAIHPYLGWVRNPQLAVPEKHGSLEIQTNAHGFLDNGPAVRRRSSDKFLIGITGGSVAWHFSWEAETHLKQQLQKLPRFANRSIEFVRLAMPGYKQPQQLMAINYVMALGGEFDLVINIDGYNDGALSVAENVHNGTALDYPRSWHARARAMTDPQISDFAFRLLALRAHRQQLAKRAIESSLSWSWTYQLIWRLRDQNARHELVVLGMAAFKTNDNSFLYHGPTVEVKSDAEYCQDAAKLWARCSRQMHALCSAVQTEYLHVLQPNQYVMGSKPLSAYELEKCFGTGDRLFETTREVYPELIKEGLRLREDGVAFSDQTMVFRNITETLYIDPWCHFNEKGNELLADAIFQEICQLRSMSSEGSNVGTQQKELCEPRYVWMCR